MSGWPNRVLAVFSIVWGLMVLAAIILASMSQNYMLSPDTAWWDATVVNGTIIGGGAAIWYGFYRLMRWFGDK
jgi:hypothetical protein